MSVSCDIRSRLVRWAGSRRTRISDFSPTRPTHWAPNTVTDPSTGQPFTEDSAWLFVAAAISNGAELKELILHKPPGKKAYVMLIPGKQSQIYVKLELGGREVIGRSFHTSQPMRT